MKGGENMPRLKTEHIARLLNQPCEAVRAMVRTGAVSWGVYIKPKSQRYGRGKYVYYPHKFAQAAGLTVEQVEGVMC
jgi:hypothetical protein